MPRLLRLLHYVRPYWLQLMASILLMAMVGLLDAFRILLVSPIFDRVLEPTPHTRGIGLMHLPGSGRMLDLQQFVPARFHNDWTIVAFALVATTLLKARSNSQRRLRRAGPFSRARRGLTSSHTAVSATMAANES